MNHASKLVFARGRVWMALARAALVALAVLAGTGSAWAQETAVLPGQGFSQGAPARNTQPLVVAAGSPRFDSAAGILFDQGSGKILWQRSGEQLRAPASVTKILTALVVLENADLNAPVTISPQARAAPGGRIYVEAGWTLTVKDLLYGLLLSSGNDAAVALAEKVSPDGTLAGFMAMANKRAAELGATRTHFVNPHGYDQPGHVTTARDLALITATALKNPTFAEIVGTRQYRLTWSNGVPHTFTNHNKMLTRYPGTVGVKTGYTNQARHTLVSAVNRNGSTLVAVTLGSPVQYTDSTSLFDWGFTHLNSLRASSTDTLGQKAAPAVPELTTPLGFIDRALQTLLGPKPSSSGPPKLSILFLAIGVPMAGGGAFIAAGRTRTQRNWLSRKPQPSSATVDFEPPQSEAIPYVSR
ncbi:MAG: D-alanyl-D-alanine carboxypeptidase family protein [Actinomycetota bacterium]